MKKDILIIMPAYNEAETIGKFLDALKEDELCKSKADILVINDGSTDKTSSIARSKGVKVITHIYNLGYGCALQTGYKHAVRQGYQYVIQIDSDGQHDVSNVANIYRMLSSSDAPDIVIGSRFLNESVTFYISSIKKIAIKMFRWLIRASTKQRVLDPTSGLQGLNRRAFLYYSYYNHFVHDFPDANMIIQMLLNNFKIKEVPAVMHARETGSSMHSGLKPILYMFKVALNSGIVIVREKFYKNIK